MTGHCLPFRRRVHATRDSEQRIAQSVPVAALLAVLWLLPLVGGSRLLFAQQSRTNTALSLEAIRRLYAAEDWRAVVAAVPLPGRNAHAIPNPAPQPDALLLRGLALAHLNRLDEAATTLSLGARLFPRDARFPTELAGVRYRQKRYPAAVRQLRRALQPGEGRKPPAAKPSSDKPDIRYAQNFLGTVELLEGNTQAALRAWNPVGRPVLADERVAPNGALPSLLLDRVFPFSPGSVWSERQYRRTRSELALQPLFAATSDELRPLADGRFDLQVHTVPHPSWRAEPVASAISTLRSLAYQAVNPEFWNLGHTAMSVTSYLRWDAQKRMILASLGSPIHSPDQRLHLDLDARNENWNLTRTFETQSLGGQPQATPSVAGLNQERIVFGAGLNELFGWRWLWQTEGEFSRRRFRSEAGLPTGTAYFVNSSAAALRSSLLAHLVDAPFERLRVDAEAAVEADRYFSAPLTHAVRVTGSLDERWLPESSGDRYRLRMQERAGDTVGRIPFDQLWMLGFDRDNPLWMRGHNGLVNGRKGAAPLGTRYLLGNLDFDRMLWHDPFLAVRVGPFVDTGRIYGSAEQVAASGSGAASRPLFGSARWMTDTGIQGRVRLFSGSVLVMGWGHNLRSGGDTFYSAISY